MERPLSPLEDLLKKVEECSVADMVSLSEKQKERMKRANLYIVRSDGEKKDEPKG